MLTAIAIPFLTALVLSLVVVPLCRLAAVRLGYMSGPREDRWHRRPEALFGGVAIAITLFLCALVFRVATAVPVLVGSAALVFLVGLVDDVLSLKPATKLIAQIIVASILV